MPSVASETSAQSHYNQVRRNQPSGQMRETDTPFEALLEVDAPSADQPPRRPEPSEPAVQAREPASNPADPKTKPASDKPEPATGAKSSDTASDAPAAEEKTAEEVAASEEAPTTGDILPETPATVETAEESDPAASEIVVAEAQIDIVQPQPAVTPQAVALPATVALDPAVAAAAGAETDPALAVAPAGNVSAPVTPAADGSVTPDLAPATDAPVLPVAEAKGAKDAPETKGKADLKPADHAGETVETPVKPGAQPELAQQVKTAQPERPQIDEDASQQLPADAKPRTDAANPAEPAQAKHALPQTASSTDITNTGLPQPLAAAPDTASLAANNQRTTLMTPAAVPVSGIAVEIAAQSRAGNNRFEIRLDPPELGRIDVRLDIDREGNVKSRLVIERSDTYDLLRRDASTLERALQQAGLKTSDSGLEFTLRDQGTAQREQRDQNQRNPERGIIPDAEILPADAVSGYTRVLGQGSGIDIRI